tara:strand:- start:139 stop:921 length:783 start_codon:yes stop_codon:yes gene_type:complete
MSEEQTYTYKADVETATTEDNLSEDEKESLEIGEQMEENESQLLAGKYKNAEELEKAYKELESKIGDKSEEVEEAEEVEEEVEVEEDKPEPKENILDQLWDEREGLTQETFEQLQKMDPVEVAKMAMQQRNTFENAGPREFSDSDIQQIENLVGGEEQYSNLVDWAGNNLPEQEVKLYDAVMSKGDPLAAYFAVQALALKYQDASGRDGELITGKPPKASNDVFNSQAELIKAMEDDRYHDDPAYRQSIQAKLERSNIDF